MNGTQIILRNVRRSTVLSDRIRKMSDHLQLLHPHVTGCRVAVESPSLHRARGEQFTVLVSVHVPGRDIVASQSRDKDVLAAVSAAFDAVRQQLIEAAKMKRLAGNRLHLGRGEIHEK